MFTHVFLCSFKSLFTGYSHVPMYCLALGLGAILTPLFLCSLLQGMEACSSLIGKSQLVLWHRLQLEHPSHTFISCNLPPSHLIKTLRPPLQLLPADKTHLCRSALQKSLFTRILHFAENTYQADRIAGGNQWTVVCHANQNTHNSCKLFVATSRTALAGNHQGPVAFSLYSTLGVRVHTS